MAQNSMPLTPAVGVSAPVLAPRRSGGLSGGLLASIIFALGVMLGVVVMAALTAGIDIDTSVLDKLLKWTPFIAEGFRLNVAMSVLAMVLGTLGGIFLGMGQLMPLRLVSLPSKVITQVFRNAPWLVLLFYCIFLVPFQVTIGGETFSIPNWLRATIGFTIPVIANFSEVVRGAVQSVPSGQWEAAKSLGYTWRQTMTSVVLPQCIKRMLPPWMNLYAILLMATPLASIVGVEEAMTNTRTALQAETQGSLLLPMYIYLLGWFFVFCYPIARLTMALETRFAIRGG
jgi:polar amino acid transport system permease protein